MTIVVCNRLINPLGQARLYQNLLDLLRLVTGWFPTTGLLVTQRLFLLLTSMWQDGPSKSDRLSWYLIPDFHLHLGTPRCKPFEGDVKDIGNVWARPVRGVLEAWVWVLGNVPHLPGLNRRRW